MLHRSNMIEKTMASNKVLDLNQKAIAIQHKVESAILYELPHVEQVMQDSHTIMFHNPMIMPDKSAWVTGGWYHHEIERTADGWRSAKLREESAYFSGMPTDLDRPE